MENNIYRLVLVQGLMFARCCENDDIIHRKLLVCKEKYVHEMLLDPVFWQEPLVKFVLFFNYA